MKKELYAFPHKALLHYKIEEDEKNGQPNHDKQPGDIECVFIDEPGMLLRDYFAAKAVHGLLMSPGHRVYTPEQNAEFAYMIAEEMLKRREKELKRRDKKKESPA